MKLDHHQNTEDELDHHNPQKIAEADKEGRTGFLGSTNSSSTRKCFA
jgi:hypothetical protein